MKRRRSEEVTDKNKGRLGAVLSDHIIMYEILPWVPLKSLFRFKLVCKEWCRVISTDPVFIASQSKRCLTLPPSLIYHNNNIGQDLSGNGNGIPDLSTYIMSSDHISKLLLASSNGLLCGSYFHRSLGSYFYVTNPVTKESVCIPNASFTNGGAFGFEPLAEKPYFILVCRCVIRDQVGFRVYSSETGIWKAADAKVRMYREWSGSCWSTSDSRSVFTGGKIYWKLPLDVLWFDVKKDAAGVVPLPFPFPYEEDEYLEGEIGEWNGELSYTLISTTTRDIEIWVLRSEFTWVKKYCLSLRRIFEDNQKMIIPYYGNIMKLKRSSKTAQIHAQQRALPYEGGDVVMFWMSKSLLARRSPPPFPRQSKKCKHGENVFKESGIVFRYNMKTGDLQLNMKPEMERWGVLLISYKSCHVSVPKPAENVYNRSHKSQD